MIHYAFENERINWDYVREYTNASWIVRDDFGLRGRALSHGLRPRGVRANTTRVELGLRARWRRAMRSRTRRSSIPRCVWQLLKTAFLPLYDIDTVMQYHRHAAGGLPEAHLRPVHVDLCPGALRNLALRDGDGPALPRCPEHPQLRDPPAAAGQHRHRGRWRSMRCAVRRMSRARPTRACSSTNLPGYLEIPRRGSTRDLAGLP